MSRNILLRCPMLILIFMCAYASAQTFQNKAGIDAIARSGFYKISITPALSTFVKADFSDLRIKDSAGKVIPYLLASDIPWQDSIQFTPLKIVANAINDSGQTVLIIENKENEKMHALFMRIKNAAVSRTIDLSGSNDRIHWYSIIENVNVEKRFIQDHDSFLENVSFPLSSYSFYRVTIYNGKSDPLDIISVYKQRQMKHAVVNDVVQNPACTFIRKDSSKVTWLSVNNSAKYHINAVFLKVKGPRFYRRQVDVLVGDVLAGNFLISSDSLVQLTLPLFNDSSFLVKIYNDDNTPLTISDISTAQNHEQIVTYLEANKSYRLEMTNPEAEKPRFDLLSFKDSIPKEIKEIGFSGVVASTVPTPAAVEPVRQIWLWPVLVAVLVVLGLFTYRLVKDVAKRP